MTSPWPARLTFKRASQHLHIAFDDGQSGSVSYVKLRQESPSAANKGHGAGPPPPQPPIPNDIDVVGADPVGHYAVRIKFSDGHNSGLYTWTLLADLVLAP
ncbi:MAG: DUF971 domain-containing protein [Pseudomonadota bacterium]